MSLDILFLDPETKEPLCCDFSPNITGNLVAYADFLKIYELLWHPNKTEGIFINPERITAIDMLPLLYQAHYIVVTKGDTAIHLLPKNGWGDKDCFNRFLTEYMHSCFKYPNAIIKTC